MARPVVSVSPTRRTTPTRPPWLWSPTRRRLGKRSWCSSGRGVRLAISGDRRRDPRGGGFAPLREADGQLRKGRRCARSPSASPCLKSASSTRNNLVTGRASSAAPSWSSSSPTAATGEYGAGEGGRAVRRTPSRPPEARFDGGDSTAARLHLLIRPPRPLARASLLELTSTEIPVEAISRVGAA